ncbi:enoyl-CoA hydratase/isomerase family protein [Mycetohabitans sp. B46]
MSRHGVPKAVGPVQVEHGAYALRGVVRATMNRPNAYDALSDAMLDALQQSFDALARTPARVMVLQGAGKAFCAGHDLKEMRAQPPHGVALGKDLFYRQAGMGVDARPITG